MLTAPTTPPPAGQTVSFTGRSGFHLTMYALTDHHWYVTGVPGVQTEIHALGFDRYGVTSTGPRGTLVASFPSWRFTMAQNC